jgi:hypothetical protein
MHKNFGLFTEKFSRLLNKVGECCQSTLKTSGSPGAAFELLKYAEARAYPAKGKHQKKKLTAFETLRWVIIIICKYVNTLFCTVRQNCI